MLVAAAISPRGLCGRLLDAALDGQWKVVASPLLLSELDAVLARRKFRRWLSEQEARQFVDGVRDLAEMLADPPAPTVNVTPDPKDEFLVALARAAKVMALVSGDPHLTDLVDLDPPVLTPAAFLDRLLGAGA